jgi:lysophospholipase L1-like esterase
MDETQHGSKSEKMVFVGASIVAGGAWQEWFPDAEVTVEATYGDTTDRLSERLTKIIELQPDVIVLLIGANDFGTNRSVEYVVRNVEYFLAMIRSEVPGARTLVHSITPRGAEFADRIQDANRHIRQYVPSLRAQFLDLWPALAMPNGDLDPSLTDDGLHLTPDGYAAWLSELRPALERLADAPPMSRPISIIRDAAAAF